jgi:hypothetical protein
MSASEGCKKNLEKIQKKKPNARFCNDTHCVQDMADLLHDTCYCKGDYYLDPCPFNADSLILSYDEQGPKGICYCCCSCFATGTPIAVNEQEFKAIEQFRVGDLVNVADKDLKWYQKAVKFSQGTGGITSSSHMMMVVFKKGNKEDFLLVSGNQLFFMPDRTLKRADKLVPEIDSLLLADGSEAPVTKLQSGVFEGGLHHIATSLETATDVDGHLISAKGVVCGDYALQVSHMHRGQDSAALDSNDMKEIDDLPTFGTVEYANKYTHLNANTYSTFKTHHEEAYDAAFNADMGIPASFKVLGLDQLPQIEKNAQLFITTEQAEDISRKTTRAPTHSNVGKDMAYYIFRLFKGFYPQVEFVLEMEDDSPNAYAYKKHGKPFVIVNGGLIRTDIVDFDLLLLIIACNVGSLFGGAPYNKARYSTRGKADYISTAKILKEVLYGSLLEDVACSALDGVKEFFDLINPEHRSIGEIPIDCRMEALWAGLMSLPLPECAGGPKKPFLEVIKAEASIEGKKQIVTISFNARVKETTAKNAENYELSLGGKIISAKVDKDNSKVRLVVKIKPNTDYKLSVYNVLSENDQTLVSTKRYAEFKLLA